MPKPKRNKEQRRRDLEIERQMRLEGYTQTEIADHLNDREDVDYTITQQMVSYDFKKIEKEWKEKTITDMDTLKAREDAILNSLYFKALNEFKASQEDREETKRRVDRTIDGEGNQTPEKIQIETKEKSKVGNPSFLKIAREIRKDIRDLWGIDSAKKLNVEGKVAHPVEMDKEQEAKFQQMIEDAKSDSKET